MEVSLKTENEEYSGKTLQIRGSEGGPACRDARGAGRRRGFTGTSMQDLRWRYPTSPPPPRLSERRLAMAGRSARLTRGLKRATGQSPPRHRRYGDGARLLRFSVLRETPMTSAINIQFQKAKRLSGIYPASMSDLRGHQT